MSVNSFDPHVNHPEKWIFIGQGFDLHVLVKISRLIFFLLEK